MTNKIRKLIKKAFYIYPDAFNNVVVSTVDWAESNMAVDYGKVAVQTSPGNYKETQLCALMDENQKRLRWCYVVEKVLDHYKFEQDKVKFIETYYFHKKSEVETCLSVGICRRTMFNWQDEIMGIAYKWAIELKAIKEEK